MPRIAKQQLVEYVTGEVKQPRPVRGRLWFRTASALVPRRLFKPRDAQFVDFFLAQVQSAIGECEVVYSHQLQTELFVFIDFAI